MSDQKKKSNELRPGSVYQDASKDALRWVVLMTADQDTTVVMGRVNKEPEKELVIITVGIAEMDAHFTYQGWFETHFIRFFPSKGDISFFGKPGLGLNDSLFGLTNNNVELKQE